MLGWLCAGGYFLGSIPFALLFTRNVVDIRTQGSGNVGATNVLRTVGKWRAAATLVCDIAKGAVPVWLALHVWGVSVTDAALVGTAAIVGHIMPIWLKGRGGKGVATTLGVYLALNYVVALATIGIWLIVAKLSKLSSLAALTGLMGAPMVAWAMGLDATLVLWMGAVWGAMMITHRQNIQRLVCGKELGCSEKITEDAT